MAEPHLTVTQKRCSSAPLAEDEASGSPGSGSWLGAQMLRQGEGLHPESQPRDSLLGWCSGTSRFCANLLMTFRLVGNSASKRHLTVRCK